MSNKYPPIKVPMPRLPHERESPEEVTDRLLTPYQSSITPTDAERTIHFMLDALDDDAMRNILDRVADRYWHSDESEVEHLTNLEGRALKYETKAALLNYFYPGIYIYRPWRAE